MNQAAKPVFGEILTMRLWRYVLDFADLQSASIFSLAAKAHSAKSEWRDAAACFAHCQLHTPPHFELRWHGTWEQWFRHPSSPGSTPPMPCMKANGNLALCDVVHDVAVDSLYHHGILNVRQVSDTGFEAAAPLAKYVEELSLTSPLLCVTRHCRVLAAFTNVIVLSLPSSLLRPLLLDNTCLVRLEYLTLTMCGPILIMQDKGLTEHLVGHAETPEHDQEIIDAWGKHVAKMVPALRSLDITLPFQVKDPALVVSLLDAISSSGLKPKILCCRDCENHPSVTEAAKRFLHEFETLEILRLEDFPLEVVEHLPPQLTSIHQVGSDNERLFGHLERCPQLQNLGLEGSELPKGCPKWELSALNLQIPNLDARDALYRICMDSSKLRSLSLHILDKCNTLRHILPTLLHLNRLELSLWKPEPDSWGAPVGALPAAPVAPKKPRDAVDLWAADHEVQSKGLSKQLLAGIWKQEVAAEEREFYTAQSLELKAEYASCKANYEQLNAEYEELKAKRTQMLSEFLPTPWLPPRLAELRLEGCTLTMPMLRAGITALPHLSVVIFSRLDVPVLECWEIIHQTASIRTAVLSMLGESETLVIPATRLASDCSSHPSLHTLFLVCVLGVQGETWQSVFPPCPPQVKPPYWDGLGNEQEEEDEEEDEEEGEEEDEEEEEKEEEEEEEEEAQPPDKPSDEEERPREYWEELTSLPNVEFHHCGSWLVNEDGSLARDYARVDIAKQEGGPKVRVIIRDD